MNLTTKNRRWGDRLFKSNGRQITVKWRRNKIKRILYRGTNTRAAAAAQTWGGKTKEHGFVTFHHDLAFNRVFFYFFGGICLSHLLLLLLFLFFSVFWLLCSSYIEWPASMMSANWHWWMLFNCAFQPVSQSAHIQKTFFLFFSLLHIFSFILDLIFFLLCVDSVMRRWGQRETKIKRIRTRRRRTIGMKEMSLGVFCRTIRSQELKQHSAYYIFINTVEEFVSWSWSIPLSIITGYRFLLFFPLSP